MDLRMPYIKLILLMGLVTWCNDSKKTDEANPILKLDTIITICPTKESLETCSGPIPYSCPIPLHYRSYAKHLPYEK